MREYNTNEIQMDNGQSAVKLYTVEKTLDNAVELETKVFECERAIYDGRPTDKRVMIHETYKACPKCDIRHTNVSNQYCEDCKPRWHGKKCVKHVFNLLNMTNERQVKCNTCTEVRKC